MAVQPFATPGKTSVTFGQKIQLKILMDPKGPRPIQHRQINDWLQYLLNFWLGGAVKAGEEEDQ